MLNVFKKNTIFGRNINSDLPLYYDNITVEGKTTQETSTQSANLCPPFTDSRWTFSNGVSVTNEGYLSIPANSGARAVINIPWNKSRTCYFKDIIVSGGNVHYSGEHFNESGTLISSNGKAIFDKDANYQDGTMWGGNNQYGDALIQTTTIKFTIQFSNYTPNPYVIKDLIISENDVAYTPFTPNMPSSDYPSELVSVGYKNELNNIATTQTINGITYTKNDDGSITLNGTATSDSYIQISNLFPLHGTFTLSGGEELGNNIYMRGLDYNDNYAVRFNTHPNKSSTATVNSDRFLFYLYVSSNTTVNNVTVYPQLTKGTQSHSYIPFGKYGIEVETHGKNHWQNSNYYTQLTSNNLIITETGFSFVRNTLTGGRYIAKRIAVKKGKTYTFSASSNDFNSNFYIVIYRGNVYGTNLKSSIYGTLTYTSTADEDLYFTFIISSGQTSASVSKIQVEENNMATNYEPYMLHINSISLNEPLRSIKNIKDILLIKNGIMTVKRYIGLKVLNGSENWGTIGNNRYWVPFPNKRGLTSAVSCLLKSNNFTATENAGDYVAKGYMTEGYYTTSNYNVFFNFDDSSSNLAAFKSWLSTHPTEVLYVLENPVIETYELTTQPMIFDSLGYGTLSDVVSDPLITEELNGSYILEFEYMKNGKFSEYLVEENILKAHGEPFSIYSVKKDTNERIKILAKHWVLNEWNKDFVLDSAPTDLPAQSALSWIQKRSINHSNISITGDCNILATARYVRKNMLDAIFNEDNSILNRFGGELSYNKNNVTVNNHRGSSSGITIRQGKNLTGAEYYLDFSTVTTRIIPVGKDGLMLDEVYIDSPLINNYATPIIRKVEVNTDNVDELRNYCNKLYESGIDKPTVSIKIDFIELSKTIEYKEYSSLETAHLGDTVIAYIPSLNLNISTRIVKVVYNDNLKRITSLELGSITPNIATSSANLTNNLQRQVEQLAANDSSVLEEAKQNATNLINHPFGGHIYIDDETGNMYIMDTTDIKTAQNVWRWGLGGLGFSSTGINGTYGIAMTQDGKIVADYITAGVLSASVINSMNLNLTANDISISSTNFNVTSDGTINAKNGKFSGSVEIEGDKLDYSNDDDADLYIHYHELEKDIEGFDGTGDIETTNESKMFSNGVFLQSKYNNSVPGSTANTNGLDKISQLNMDLYSTYDPVYIRRFFRDANNNITGESNSKMKYGGFEAHDTALGDFSVIGSEITLTDINNKSLTISPDLLPTLILSNWYSTSSTTLTGAKVHKLLIILAKPSSSAAIVSLIIPTDSLTTSNQQFQCSDESNYVSFNIRYNGSNILITGAGRSSDGTIISAWRFF